MRFRWNKDGSEKAVICMAYGRFWNKKMDLDEALKHTIALHSCNPEAIPQRTLDRLRKLVLAKAG